MSVGNQRVNQTFPYGCASLNTTTTYSNGKQWSGGDDPNKVVPQPYTMTRTVTVPGTFTYSPNYAPSTTNTGVIMACYGPVTFTLPDRDAMLLTLMSRLSRKVRGHDFNAGVSAGEARESVGMIRHRARAINRDLVILNNKRLAKRAFKKFIPAAAWLEAVYGWLPLMNDVKSAAEALAANLEASRKRKFRASVSKQGTINHAYISSGRMDVMGGCSRTLRGLVIMKEDQSLVTNLQLDDPASIAWELVPYSFVADWFLPIGTWLEARSFLAKTQAEFVISESTIRKSYVTGLTPYYEIVRSLGRYYQTHFTFTRSIGVPSLPLPKARSLKEVFNDWRHTIDSLALLDRKLRDTVVWVR